MKKPGFTGKTEKKKRFYNRYGFYIALFALSFVIGLTSYYQTYKNSKTTPEKAIEILDDGEIPTFIVPSNIPSAISTKAPEKTKEPKETKDIEDTNESKATEQVAAATLAFIKPVVGEHSVSFSSDKLIYSKTMSDWRAHTGIDIVAEEGAAVLATANGTVRKVYDDGFYGHTIVIDHGGTLKSIYSALRASVVLEGQSVVQGEKVGEVGNTAVIESADGAHLHFEVEKDGAKINPLDLIDENIIEKEMQALTP